MVAPPGLTKRLELLLLLLHKNAACCFEQILEVAPHKTAAVRQGKSHLKLSKQVELGILVKQRQPHKRRSPKES